MNIEAGKFYRTRDGRKIGPMRIWMHGTSAPWEWPNRPKDGVLYRDSGVAEFSDGYEGHDIVSEWLREPVDKDTAEDKPEWGPWIGWNGGECPVDFGDFVQAISASGTQSQGPSQYHSWGNDLDADVVVYRISKKPVKGAVTLQGAMFSESWGFCSGRHNPEDVSHRITFDTIDGKPDCASIKMEEIDNA